MSGARHSRVHARVAVFVCAKPPHTKDRRGECVNILARTGRNDGDSGVPTCVGVLAYGNPLHGRLYYSGNGAPQLWISAPLAS